MRRNDDRNAELSLRHEVPTCTQDAALTSPDERVNSTVSQLIRVKPV